MELMETSVEYQYSLKNPPPILTPWGIRVCVGCPAQAVYSADIIWNVHLMRLYFDGNLTPLAVRLLAGHQPQYLPSPPRGWSLPPDPSAVTVTTGQISAGQIMAVSWITDDLPPSPEPEPEPAKEPKRINEMELEDYKRGIDNLWSKRIIR